MLGSLGSTLSLELNQQDKINRGSAKAIAIEERRARIAEAQMLKELSVLREDRELDKSPEQGFVTRFLSIATGTSMFVGAINSIVNKLDDNGASGRDSVFKMLQKGDPSASKEDIDSIIELLTEHSVKFNETMLRNDMETHEAMNNVEYRQNQLEKQLAEQKLNETQREQNILEEISNLSF